jgi:hypothetical protein
MDLHMGSALFWPRIVLYSIFVRRYFVVCPHEPLLKLSVPRVKKRMRNTGLEARDAVNGLDATAQNISSLVGE